jgi:hypothetical protein
MCALELLKYVVKLYLCRFGVFVLVQHMHDKNLGCYCNSNWHINCSKTKSEHVTLITGLCQGNGDTVNNAETRTVKITVLDDPGLLGYDTVSLDNQFTKF